MLVKMNFGRKKGEIVDLRNDVALEFLKDGRALQAYGDPAPEAPRVVATLPPQPPENKTRRQLNKQLRDRKTN